MFVCYLPRISLQKETNHDLEEALPTDQREGLQNQKIIQYCSSVTPNREV